MPGVVPIVPGVIPAVPDVFPPDPDVVPPVPGRFPPGALITPGVTTGFPPVDGAPFAANGELGLTELGNPKPPLAPWTPVTAGFTSGPGGMPVFDPGRLPGCPDVAPGRAGCGLLLTPDGAETGGVMGFVTPGVNGFRYAGIGNGIGVTVFVP